MAQTQTIDIKHEVGQLSDGARQLLGALLKRYQTDETNAFGTDVVGIDPKTIPLLADELVDRGFAFKSTARPGIYKLNRARMDSLRTVGI
jgi:hypothetical protein